MVTKARRLSKEDRAFARGVRRISLSPPPLDPIPEYEPVTPAPPPTDVARFEVLRFEAYVDPALNLSEDATRRIEKQIRQAVLMEVAQLDFLPEISVKSGALAGRRILEVKMARD